MYNKHTKKNNGFTLAETLITLVIVGVVAAITIPTLIAHYRTKELEDRLSKTYSTLFQAINHAVSINGPVDTWKLESAKQVVEDYFLPNMRFMTMYTNPAGKYNFNRYQYKYLNGSSAYFNGGTVYIFQDGFALYMAIENSHHWQGMRITVDVNGPKKPNIMGKDIFRFMYTTHLYDTGKESYHRKLQPEGIKANTKPENFVSECSKQGQGVNCAALIAINSWHFPTKKQYVDWGGVEQDYPW